ncbi:GAP family protein [Rhodococcus sp. UNC363MFTsu5.1]|uniref:GAP family protein n=1 Tax=Rhodococcus sp. UNC363MFTsu5.1 TaxID=1449069 RepID=UPI000483FA5C|nr:GAP family protein [Rhodococcus sp. UNC363MFTsu5.1]
MDIALVLGLVALALVDSTSLGTLVIPLWLLMSPERPPVRRMVAYLGVIAGFYLAVGVLILLAASTGIAAAGSALRGPVALGVQLALGLGLFAISWRFDSRSKDGGAGGRVTRWRAKALDAQSSGSGLAVLAMSAGALELVTMLPYLAAIGLMVSTGLSLAVSIPLLAGYCAMMVLPACLLILARTVAHTRAEPWLTRADGFLSRHADSALGWVLGIAGFLLARDAAAGLFFH